MVHVLLTGGNGFIATHILDLLLSRGHSVTVTVRSEEKGRQVLARHPNANELDISIVPDFTVPEAFEGCFTSDRDFEAVLHVASPYYFSVIDAKQELLDPSINGTKALLRMIHEKSRSVKKVVLTSSFATILNSYKPNTWAEHTYTEQDWNPLTMEDAMKDIRSTYRASKLFAEKAAWDFVQTKQPSFSLVSICPTFVFGPVFQPLSSLGDLNTSSQRISDFINGKFKDGIPDTGVSFYLWIDVRDLAMAHVKAIEDENIMNRRYLLTAGYFNNREICEIIRDRFPEYKSQLPSKECTTGGYPKEDLYNFDNSRATNELNMTCRTLEESVVDTILSLKEISTRRNV